MRCFLFGVRGLSPFAGGGQFLFDSLPARGEPLLFGLGGADRFGNGGRLLRIAVTLFARPFGVQPLQFRFGIIDLRQQCFRLLLQAVDEVALFFLATVVVAGGCAAAFGGGRLRCAAAAGAGVSAAVCAFFHRK